MEEFKKTVAQYILSGLKVLQTNKHKQPKQSGWQSAKPRPNDFIEPHVGVMMGDWVEAIDFDLKYDTSGCLMTKFKEALNQEDSTILPKMTIESTPSGGYHFVYKCREWGKNTKLANRPTTDKEKQEAYEIEMQASGDANKADRARKGAKVRVLIETRGLGGFIQAYPSDGYKLVKGSFENLQEITPQQRETLLNVARSFNTYFENKVEYKPRDTQPKIDGLTPWEDYNERADVVSLLCNYGWSVVREQGAKVIMKRPGQTTSLSSGNYDRNLNLFSVFSTSTEFENERGYTPFAVYTILLCNGDFSEAAKKLYTDGYGDRAIKKTPEAEYMEEKKAEKIQLIEKLDFIIHNNEIDDYLTRVENGTLEMGKSTGIPELDQYFLLKRAHFNIVNGHDNVGKSLILWYLAVLSAILHGWKWGILSHENNGVSVFRKLCELYVGKPWTYMNQSQRNDSKNWVHLHFKIITNKHIYSYRNVIDMGKMLKDTYLIDALLVDPYNSLSVEMENTHQWHYNATSEMRQFVHNEDCSMFVNTHVVTGASRAKDDGGHQAAPNKADTEGGTKFASRADDFLTIHRLTQDRILYNQTQLFVRKVKDSDTGGRPSPIDAPIIVKMENQSNFVSLDGTNFVTRAKALASQQTSLITPNTSFLHGNEAAPF